MITITKNSETKLMEMLPNIKHQEEEYYAIIFNFSELEEKNRSEYQLQIALNIINEFFETSTNASIFLLKNQDIIVIFEGHDTQSIQKIIHELRHLFGEDKLAFISEGVENHRFSAVYILQLQWQAFFDNCRERVSSTPLPDGKIKDLTPKYGHRPLGLQVLLEIEQSLDNFNITHLMRSQTICALTPNANPRDIKKLFHELYVSIINLRELFNFDINQSTNKNLFQYLTERLDLCVIRILKTRLSLYSSGPVSLNLNVNTIYSKDFQELVSLIEQNPKVSLITEFDIGNIFMDITSFNKAIAYLQKINYRVCLDGVNKTNLLYVNRESLGFDLMKLQWSGEVSSMLSNPENVNMVEAVRKCGSNRIILSRCDNQNSVEYGHALGIALFQGWYFDKLLNPHSKVVN